MSLKCKICKKEQVSHKNKSKEKFRNGLCGECYQKKYWAKNKGKISKQRKGRYWGDIDFHSRELLRCRLRDRTKDKKKPKLKNYYSYEDYLKYKAKNNLKIKIRNKTRYVHSDKKEVCLDCGSKENLEFHHLDYSNPDTFIVLCVKCHNKRHRKPKSIKKILEQLKQGEK